MAIRRMRLEKTQLSNRARARAFVEPGPMPEPPGGLYPLHAAAYEIDEYRMLKGWPVAVPKLDIRASALVSCTGEVVSSREAQTGVTTGAFVRWVADEELYDPTTLTWAPLQGGNQLWYTSVEYAPTLIQNYEYRMGSERFTQMTALNFDSDTQNHMWTDLSRSLGSAGGYTVIMVASPNSIYGNDEDVSYNGLWSFGVPTPPGETFAEETGAGWNSLTIQGNFVYYESESVPRTRSVAIGDQLERTSPTYLAAVFSRPEVTLYAATGPDSMSSITIPGGDPVGLDDRVVLGRTTGDVQHTADLALFDLGLYPEALSAEKVRAEVAMLARVYGGDS